jgi:hypothetical protein
MTDFELWVYRGLILFLSSILIKIIWARMKKDDEKEKEFFNKVTQLEQSFIKVISDLREEMGKLRESMAGVNINCPERHINIDRRITANGDSIKELYQKTNAHSEEIAAIKVTISSTRKAK